MILSEIEPATLRLVAQCLNQQNHRVPGRLSEENNIKMDCKEFGYDTVDTLDVPLHTLMFFPLI